MGRLIRLDQYVKDAIEECPLAAKDDNLLIGLVYERYLGEAKASIYSFRWCKKNFKKARVPDPESVIKAKERVVRLYIKHKKK